MKIWLTALSLFSSLQPAAAVSLFDVVQLTTAGYSDKIIDVVRNTEPGFSCRPRHDVGRCRRHTPALKGEHA
jgi:hypothetical protein